MLCPKVIDCHKGFCFYALFMSLWHFVPGLKKTGMDKSHCWKLIAGSNLWHECCLRLNPEKQVWQISAQQVVYNNLFAAEGKVHCGEKRWQHINVRQNDFALLASRLLFGLIVREICDPSSWNAEPTRWSRCNLLAALIYCWYVRLLFPHSFFRFPVLCVCIFGTRLRWCRTAAPHVFIFFCFVFV